MKLVPHGDLTRDEWVAVYAATYSPELTARMGNDWMGQGVVPPTFGQFFVEAQNMIKKKNLYLWAIVNGDGNVIGLMSLTRTPEVPEWELGTAVADPKFRERGYGVRAHRQILEFAFHDLEAEWVWAISEVRSETVEKLMERGGYRRFAHFYLMHRDWFVGSRWDRRK